PNAATVTLTLLASVDTEGTLVNVAQKTMQTEADPNPLNDQATVLLNAGTSADIEVGKAISSAKPPVGGDVTFTVTATNHGPSPATGVVVDDPLPAGVSFVSATPSQGPYDQGTRTWTVGDLAATRAALLSITARATAPGALTNNASVPPSRPPH